MQYIAHSKLTQIANNVVKEYMELPEIREMDLVRIVPELLLDKILGLKIEYRTLSKNGRILGMTAYDNDGIEIIGADGEPELYEFDGRTVLIADFLERERRPGRRNYTIGHEGCHHILHRLYPEHSNVSHRIEVSYRSDYTTPEIAREEYMCNSLTSSILMPEQMIYKYMNDVGLHGTVKILNKQYRSEEYTKVSYIAYALGVSMQALVIRMHNMGLIQNVCTKSNQLIDIERDD